MKLFIGFLRNLIQFNINLYILRIINKDKYQTFEKEGLISAMKIISRNSMSYLPPIGIVGRLSNLFNQCLKHSYVELYFFYGIKVFDFKISFHKNHVVFKNGLTMYKTISFYDVLNFLNQRKDCTVHLSLDMSHQEYDEEMWQYRKRFIDICTLIEEIYSNINFFGGEDLIRKDQVYLFKYEHEHPNFQIADIFEHKKSKRGKFLSFIQKSLRKISPRLHAFIFNNYIKNHFKGSEDYIILDFI